MCVRPSRRALPWRRHQSRTARRASGGSSASSIGDRERRLPGAGRGQPIQHGVLLAHEVREVGERCGKTRVELARERGEEAVPYARTLERRVEVARVAAPRERVLDEERAHLDAVAAQQRADDAPAPRPDPAEPARAGPTERARKRTVSAWSSRVWPVAIFVAPRASAARSRNA